MENLGPALSVVFTKQIRPESGCDVVNLPATRTQHALILQLLSRLVAQLKSVVAQC